MNRVLDDVAALNLPRGQFAIFGSGPLLVRGVISAVNDVDIICRSSAWPHAQSLGERVYLDEYDVEVVSIDDGNITIGREWAYGDFDIDELIDSAECIDGLPFVRLKFVIAYKRIADRRKDREHLQALQATSYWPDRDQVAT